MRGALRLASAVGLGCQAQEAPGKVPSTRHGAFSTSIVLAGFMGLDVAKAKRTLLGLPKYLGDARTYTRLSGSTDSFEIRVRELYPVLGEDRASAGEARGHYFHQDLWAARKVFERAPLEHFDVGSSISGFVAHLLTFRHVTVIDIRPLPDRVEGLSFIEGDATHLSGIADDSLDSVSSLHAVEHFGLGRYGDAVDPLAARKAMAALTRVLKPGGRLYFAVPIGRERLMFNAHRIFAPGTILAAFSQLTLVSFAAVDDAGHLVLDTHPHDYHDADYSCGLFEFEKPGCSDSSSAARASTPSRQ
jgi:SAM-dependent methyltransferase